jgi:hypothetical protein
MNIVDKDRQMSEEENEPPLWAKLIAAGFIVAGFITVTVWILCRWHAGLD